jgi:hypothetical protein
MGVLNGARAPSGAAVNFEGGRARRLLAEDALF